MQDRITVPPAHTARFHHSLEIIVTPRCACFAAHWTTAAGALLACIHRIMKTSFLLGATLVAASFSLSAIAGPDFYVIEKAREAKRVEQRAAAAQVHQTQAATNAPDVTCKL